MRIYTHLGVSMMTTDELTRIFRDRYAQAPKGMVVTTIHLFGIEFANDLEGQPIKELCQRAGVPVSYHAEIHKGMRLSRFVRIKP